MTRLPAGGLSEPLKPDEIHALDEDQKLIYSKWKGKYEAALRMLKKQKNDTTSYQRNYTIEEAQLFF